MKIKVLFKTEEQLKNAYKDYAGDFWKTYEDYDAWEDERTDENMMLDVCIYGDEIGRAVNLSNERYDLTKWGIKKVLTKENDPEYFL